MGRAPCCDKAKVKRGPWSPDEDAKLKAYIEEHGTGGNWIALPQKIGLKRCGKSCRLRWLNYLRPNIKHGGFSQEEDRIICSLYISIGSRWSIIAAQLPGRTDNDIKNYWNTRLKKKLLGKQQKEPRQARRAGFKQEAMKRESDESAVNIGGVIDQQAPYWPQLPAALLQGVNLYQEDSTAPFMDQESIDILSSSTSMNSMDSSTSCSQLPSTAYCANGEGLSPNMFGGLDNFRVGLEDLAYSNPQGFEGLESFYGTTDMANGSSTGACSGESSNWGSRGPLVYPQLVPQYENCLPDSSFFDSIYFGPPH